MADKSTFDPFGTKQYNQLFAEYIVIFKEDATQAQIDKCADEVTRSGTPFAIDPHRYHG